MTQELERLAEQIGDNIKKRQRTINRYFCASMFFAVVSISCAIYVLVTR
jgi:hypothetical protein